MIQFDSNILYMSDNENMKRPPFLSPFQFTHQRWPWCARTDLQKDQCWKETSWALKWSLRSYGFFCRKMAWNKWLWLGWNITKTLVGSYFIPVIHLEGGWGGKVEGILQASQMNDRPNKILSSTKKTGEMEEASTYWRDKETCLVLIWLTWFTASILSFFSQKSTLTSTSRAFFSS